VSSAARPLIPRPAHHFAAVTVSVGTVVYGERNCVLCGYEHARILYRAFSEWVSRAVRYRRRDSASRNVARAADRGRNQALVAFRKRTPKRELRSRALLDKEGSQHVRFE
jgi:hypothetical protein